MPTPPKTILVIRMSAIGDIVLTTPFLSGLRRLHPQSRILWACKQGYESLLEAHPAVDGVLAWNRATEPFRNFLRRTAEEQPDLVFDLHGVSRSRILAAYLHRRGAKVLRPPKNTLRRLLLVLFKLRPASPPPSVLERYADLLRHLGLPDPPSTPLFFLSRRGLAEARKALPEGFRGHITVCDEATATTKRWDKFPDLVGRLLEKGERVVLIGTNPGDSYADLARRYRRRFLDLRGLTSLQGSAAVIRLGRALVCNDTGMMHIADGLGVPLVSLWGPTVRDFGFFPSGARSVVLEVPRLPCRPCSLHGSPRCPLGHFRCMRDIPLEAVLAALERLAPPQHRPAFRRPDRGP